MKTYSKCLVVLLVFSSAALVAAQQAVLVDELTTDNFALPAEEDMPGAGPLHREEWFQSVWHDRRSSWPSKTDEDQGALVLFGDSITQGWGEDFSQHFPGVKIANRGIGGDTTRGMLYRLDEDVLALNPSGVVMLMGTNDIEMGATPEMIVDNFKLILAKLKEHDDQMPLVLCLVFPSSAKMNRPLEKIRKLNELYAEAVKGDPQVTVLDTWTLYANPEGDAIAELFPDLLHPNGAGYQKWAAALRPIFATLGFLETEPDNFTPEPGFESLFNGHDLTGWGYRPTSEEDLRGREAWQKADPHAAAWPIVTEAVDFPGQTATDDGRFVAKNGRLIVTTPPEGRKIQQLWTTREFPQDFTLKLEFRATPNADSGVYLRGPQLQCRDYPLAGPYKDLKKYKPQDWNELEVTVADGVAHATCNGEVLEDAMQLPATGPIGVEGDRGQMEYRRIRIKTSP